MTSIYDRFDSATRQISAYAVMKDTTFIGRIVVKYPSSGEGRLTVYVHEYGYEMVSGFARGFGYDKLGAALHNAYTKVKKLNDQLPPLYAALCNVTYDGQFRDVLSSHGFTLHSVI